MDRNKLLMTIGIPVAVVGLGVILFYQIFPDTNPAPINPINNEQNQTTPGQEETTSSRYVEYTKETFDGASNKKRILFFYASWCPICKPADYNFTQNADKIPQDVVLIRVNYRDPETDSEEQALADKYGITYQHTFAQIDSSGKVITKWNGGEIDELLEKHK